MGRTSVLGQPGGERQRFQWRRPVIFNSHPNVATSEFDSLKALLFNCVRFGPDSQNRTTPGDFRTQLQGRIAYAAMINARRGAKLLALFERIDWQRSSVESSD